jgi:hypothetical protein
MEAIKEFPAPPLCKKLIHRYRDRQRLPDVRIVEAKQQFPPCWDITDSEKAAHIAS